MNNQIFHKSQFINAVDNNVFIPDEVAIISAGRWGKIICTILAQFQPRISKIHLVSQRNSKSTKDWLRNKSLTTKDQFNPDQIDVWSNLDQLLHNSNFEVAFVTNLPAEHYETTKLLLKQGKHVLVEKPFVLNTEHARELISLANEKNLVLAVGLEYILASYVHYFRQVIELLQYQCFTLHLTTSEMS